MSVPLPPVVLSIAGSDSGGGAGIQADLKTFEAHCVFGTTVITAITAQNTVGVRAIHPVPVDIIRAQFQAVMEDLPVAAIKIGMLATAEVVLLISELLKGIQIPIVLDPVLVATSGDPLLQQDAIAALKDSLFPLATIITPNTHEAALLSGIPIQDIPSMRLAAARLATYAPAGWVLIKGGHLPGSSMATDLLLHAGEEQLFELPYLPVGPLHGTGCTLSSGIAAQLALGLSIPAAVAAAKHYVHTAIYGALFGLGHGSAPLMHTLR